MEDLQSKLFKAVEQSQQVLAKYIDPLSVIPAQVAINELLGILDNKELISSMKEAAIIFRDYEEKVWPESKNISRTRFYKSKEVLEVEFKNGKRYQYFDFPKKLWMELFDAVSIGFFLHSRVKGHYRFSEI